jgi:hypothetical protein
VKIRLNYQPADKELQSWEFDPDDLDNLDSERIEIVGGETWDSYAQWWYLLQRGNVRATRALLWTYLRHANPALDFNEIKFKTGEVGLEDVEDEPVGKDEPDDTNTDSPSAQPDSPAASEN